MTEAPGIGTAVVLLNWNGKHFLEDCLPDLLAQDHQPLRIVVADSGSTDGSQFWLRAEHPDVELIELYTNMGFAEGNNVAIRHVLGDPAVRWIVLVNNDMRFAKDWLSTLIAGIEARPRAGAVQGPIVFAHDPEVINSLGIAFEPSLWAFDDGVSQPYSESLAPREIFGATAGAAVYRREAVEDILDGGAFFDPRFFSYYEDVDVALRLRRRGWTSHLVPAPPVIHIGSATGGREVFRKVFFLERNYWFYLVRNVPLTVILGRLGPLLRKRAERVWQWARVRDWKTFTYAIRGNLAWLVWLPWLIRSRRDIARGGPARNVRDALAMRPEGGSGV